MEKEAYYLKYSYKVAGIFCPPIPKKRYLKEPLVFILKLSKGREEVTNLILTVK